MKYYYVPHEEYTITHGKVYYCNHPIYDSCTIYKMNGKGLAVIQQRFNPALKVTYWGPIKDYLIDDIFSKPLFAEVFAKYAAAPDTNGLYPTLTVRQIMHALGMKPLKKSVWETVFDRKPL